MLRVALAILSVTAALLLVPAHAGAHAKVTASVPADGAVLTQAPDAVVIQLSDTASVAPGGIQVFAPDESRIDVGAPSPASGTRLVQRIRAEQEGTYGVAYRVSSEDGHVITGAFTFTTGTQTESAGGASASRDAAQVDPTLLRAFSAARFVEFVALLVAAGGGLFACLIAPGWKPRLVLPALLTLLMAYAAGFFLNAAIIGGTPLGDLPDERILRAAAETPFGLSLQVRAIVAAVAVAPALLLMRVRDLPVAARVAMAVVFAGLAASLSITGHAVTTEPTWLRLPADMVHVAASAIWIGGLVQLAFMSSEASTRLSSIVRFSRVAFVSVGVLLVTGIYATWAELGLKPDELLNSRYGRLIAAKLLLFLGAMPLAGANMRAFVPQVQRRPQDAPRMLRQYVWRELVLLVVVIALTVWLIATPQPA